MHEGGKDDERDGDGAHAIAAARRHQRDPVAPAQAELVAGEPGQCIGTAHSAATGCAAGSATSVRKVSSRLAAVFPVLRCSSSSVPSAIKRPLGDDADAVGHALGDFENMRGHDDGAAGGDALAQDVLDQAGGAGIEPGERLIEDDELGIVHQRAGERHFLPHASGKSLAALMRVRFESEPADHFARARFRSCRRRCARARRRIRDIRTA